MAIAIQDYGLLDRLRNSIMHGKKRIARGRVSVGVVHRVDMVNREVAVLVNGELLTFDVPVGCAVVLHGEPVKLRMVQPKDRVKITHASRGGRRAALAVEVQPDENAGHVVGTLPRIGGSGVHPLPAARALDDFHPGMVDP